jgi:hypothetical protein
VYGLRVREEVTEAAEEGGGGLADASGSGGAEDGREPVGCCAGVAAASTDAAFNDGTRCNCCGGWGCTICDICMAKGSGC